MEKSVVSITSIPNKAMVWVDGHRMGETPCSIALASDFHVIEVKSAGCQTWRQVVSGDTGKPMQLQATLNAVEVPNTPKDMPDADAILHAIPADIRGALADVIRKELASHPATADNIGPVWMGVAGDEAYALTLRRLPEGAMGDRVALSMAEGVRMKATSEVFLTTELTQQAQETGLDDLTYLRRACRQVAMEGAWGGHVSSLKSVGIRYGGWVVGFARAPKAEIAKSSNFKVNREGLRIAYACEMSKMADELLIQKKAEDALALYYHLHVRQMASRWNYLNTARSFHAIGKKSDAMKVLSRVYEAQHAAAGVDWLEACGNLAEAIETDSPLAKAAYDEATQRLLKP